MWYDSLDLILNNSLFFLLWQVWHFYVFSYFHSFSENGIIHKLKKIFFASFLRLVFISIYGFSQAFWLNLMTLWTFFKTNPWFNAYFKFLMCITYSVLLCKFATGFSTFSIFILSDKNGQSLWSSCKFFGYWTSTSRKYPPSLSLLQFFKKSSLNWGDSSIYSKLFTRYFWDITQSYKLSEYLR